MGNFPLCNTNNGSEAVWVIPHLSIIIALLIKYVLLQFSRNLHSWTFLAGSSYDPGIGNIGSIIFIREQKPLILLQ